MTEEDFLWTDCDTADDQDELKENKNSTPAVTNVVTEEVEAQTLSGRYACSGARSTVIDNLVSDVRRETDSSGAGHTGRDHDDNELEGLKRLQTAFEELKSHMTEAWNDAMVLVEDELVFTEINTLMTVAREAADKVIETSTRFAREARVEIPDTLDAQGRQNPPCAAPLNLMGKNAYGVRSDYNCGNRGEEPRRPSQLPNQEGYGQTREDRYTAEWVPIDARGFSKTTKMRPRELNDEKLQPKTDTQQILGGSKNHN